jgi:hypothetical protein
LIAQKIYERNANIAGSVISKSCDFDDAQENDTSGVRAASATDDSRRFDSRSRTA